jgi:hypothetical protein
LTTCLLVLPVQAKYSGGSGTAQDPYQIATAADLIALGEDPNDYDKHFLLTADIDLDPKLPGRKVFDKAVIATATYVTGVGFQGTPFSGVFDGKGHVLCHLTISGKDYVGLFGELASAAEVKDLGAVDANITGSGVGVGGLVGGNSGNVTNCYSTGALDGNDCVGGLVGSNGGTVSQCYSTGVVSGNSNVGGLVGAAYIFGFVTRCYSSGVVSGNSKVGGLVGLNGGSVTDCHSTATVSGLEAVGGLVGDSHGSMTQCYSSGVVSGTNAVGGLAGVNYYAGVDRCYSTSAVSGKDDVGGLVGRNHDGFVDDCYSTGVVSGTGPAVGGLVGDNYEGTVSASFWDTQSSGQTKSAGGTGKMTAEMYEPNTFRAAGWDVGPADGPDGVWAEPTGGGYPILYWQLPGKVGLPRFSGGTGEPNDPYRISTAQDLNSIGHNPRLMKCHFRLVADLDLTGFHFYPIGDTYNPYAGSFDGNGHTISHLTVKGESCVGLFRVLGSWAEVRDLGVVDVNIIGAGDYVGGLVGSCGSWNGPASRVTRCYSSGVVSGNSKVGGLVGHSTGAVTQCYSTGSVAGSFYVGGLVGENGGAVTDCHSAGAVSGTRQTIGGLVGYSHGAVTHCYSTGVVSGGSYVGGLVGWNDGGSVTQCYSADAVAGTMSLGGLVAWNSGGVTNSFWDMQTSGQAVSAGGTGKTTAEMQTAKTFLDAGWDFVAETANGTEDVWWINEGKDYPRLWWELIPEN